MEPELDDLIFKVAKGKPFVFVAMPFGRGARGKKRWKVFYDSIKNTVKSAVGLSCIRADELQAGGHNILDTIHRAIQVSRLVIGEISEQNPNVMYELGYARALGRHAVPLIRKGAEVPADVRGLVTINYEDSVSGYRSLHGDLGKCLRNILQSPVRLWREMLEAPIRAPVYVTAAPKYPAPDAKEPLRVYDHRTFGDNLGIRGLLQAFGSFLGENETELISAKFCPPKLAARDVSLYLIGSSKVNSLTEKMLARLQSGTSGPRWTFHPRLREKPRGNYTVQLRTKDRTLQQRVTDNQEKGTWPRRRNGPQVTTVACGILVRGPHPDPDKKGRLVLIMAGPESLGTGAACLAATASSRIELVREELAKKKIDLADKTSKFWVLVRGKCNNEGMLNEEDVTVLDCGLL